MKALKYFFVGITFWFSQMLAGPGPEFEILSLDPWGGYLGSITFSAENIGGSPQSTNGVFKWSIDDIGTEHHNLIGNEQILWWLTGEGFTSTIYYYITDIETGTHTFYLHTYTDANISSPHYTSSMEFYLEIPEMVVNEVRSVAVLKDSITNPQQIAQLSIDQRIETRAYYDALGRNLQTIGVAASPDEKDVISPVEYDALGLVSKNRLPYVLSNTGNNGEYQETALEDQLAYYQSPPSSDIATTDYPFAESGYEKSPLLRALEQGSVGQSWRLDGGATINVSYSANNTSTVRKLSYDSQNEVINSSNTYDAGELYLTRTTDENQHDSYEYTDKSGKTILKKTTNNGVDLLTYYIYDEFDNLRVILPPMAVVQITDWNSTTQLQNALDKWGTIFKYDGYQRVVEKKIPEAEPIYTIYDRLGRVVLTQDGNLRVQGKWFFIKYDVYGRVILTGIYTNGYTREQMQAHLDENVTTYYETPALNGIIGYTNIAYPSVSENDIRTITYYDNYDFDRNGSPYYTYNEDSEYDPNGEKVFYRLQGQATGVRAFYKEDVTPRVKVITADETYDTIPQAEEEILCLIGEVRLIAGFRSNSGQKLYCATSVEVGSMAQVEEESESLYLTSVNFYDKYGRVIQTQSENQLGGTDVSYREYDFSGKVLKSKLVHQANGGSVTVRNRFEYDHAGRTLEVWQQNNDDDFIRLSTNEYNNLGQLVKKHLHYLYTEPEGDVYLQTTNFSYNERGWLTKINDPSNLGDDLFAMKLYYNEAHGYLNAPAQFNGNISATTWATPTGNALHGYGYQYDDINQLENAEYGEYVAATWNTDEAYSVNNLSYDLNGNIATLNRRGPNTSYIDQLTYTYNGNKLERVEDAISTHYGYDFKNGVTDYTEYDYDANGNMIRDDNKGITVTYNELNLSTKVNFGSGDRIEWTYSPTGEKWKKLVYSNYNLTERTDYVGGFVYKNNDLAFFHTSEGRVVKNGANYEYQYALKDHLGNTRVMFGDANGDGTPEVVQETHYYPFGLQLAGLGSNNGSPENKFLYNGKELQDEHGLYQYDFGWRPYDPQLAMWHSIDPAGQFYSPYIYGANNPINGVDPDGREWHCCIIQIKHGYSWPSY